jgi:uncharacterized membrane protein
MLRQVLLSVHGLSAMVWIGGMFFAIVCLRPASIDVLAPPQRLALWLATLRRFFVVLALAIVALLLSGVALWGSVAVRATPPGWLVMLALGSVMTVVYGVVALALFPTFRGHVLAAQWPQAAQGLNRIRWAVVFNLILGVVVVIAVASTR